VTAGLGSSENVASFVSWSTMSWPSTCRLRAASAGDAARARASRAAHPLEACRRHMMCCNLRNYASMSVRGSPPCWDQLGVESAGPDPDCQRIKDCERWELNSTCARSDLSSPTIQVAGEMAAAAVRRQPTSVCGNAQRCKLVLKGCPLGEC
jgi:hypothetical protein